MEKKATELVFILDKSGSMGGLENDTIGGYNSTLKKQREVKGKCNITTVLFDHGYELLHDRIDIRAIDPITEKEYFVEGSTALLDAIGKTIDKIGNVQKRTKDEYRAEKVLFVIITDGMENASRIYSSRQIKQMIERQKERYGWEFIFLGANIDAVETAAQYGIDASRAQNYHGDRRGVAASYDAIGEAVSCFCQLGEIDDAWNAEIENDFISREKGQES